MSKCATLDSPERQKGPVVRLEPDNHGVRNWTATCCEAQMASLEHVIRQEDAAGAPVGVELHPRSDLSMLFDDTLMNDEIKAFYGDTKAS